MGDLGTSISKRCVWRADFLIFVTVGNAVQGFDRLLMAVEEMKSSILNNADIFVQYGNSRIIPNNCSSVAFMSRDEFDEFIANASIIITHGGEGSIMKCLQAGKRPIVVPRQKIFGEHVNDHQFELVRRLETQDRVVAVYDIAGLTDAVMKARDRGILLTTSSGDSGTRVLVKNYLDRLANEKDAGR